MANEIFLLFRKAKSFLNCKLLNFYYAMISLSSTMNFNSSVLSNSSRKCHSLIHSIKTHLFSDVNG